MDVTIHPRNEGILNLKNLVEGLERQSSRARGPNGAGEDGTGRHKTPIVLVSGFTGWSEALFGTFNYWGGFEDLPSVLVNCGYAVIVVRIGPLSSNWERACEMYAQLNNIRDGRGFDRSGAYPPAMIDVDYGYGNSIGAPNDNEKNGTHHPCLTKQAVLFGEIDPAWQWSESNPLHFICHSQGGNTMRMLIERMTGSYSSYFKTPNQQNWIKSVVTLATPHMGTTVTDVVQEFLPDDYLDIIVRGVVSASFNSPPNPRFYDLQLDHLGFCREGTEDFMTMYNRLRVRICRWWESNQNGFYDNSIEGVANLNKFAAAPSPDIYFFTMSSDTTEPIPEFKITDKDLEALHVPFPKVVAPVVNVGVAACSFICSKMPQFPRMMRDGTSTVLQIADNHLKALGYFHNLPTPGNRIPRNDVMPMLAPTAFGMSGYELKKEQKTILGISTVDFAPNDGVVNTLSMRGPLPLEDRRMSEIADFPLAIASKPAAVERAKGKYWHLGKNVTMDHADVIGVFTADQTWREVKYMYCLLARLFAQLP